MSDASDSGRYLRKFQKIITLRAYYVTAGVKKPRLEHRANALGNEPYKFFIYNVQFTIYNFLIKHRPECSTMFYGRSIAQKHVSLAM